MLSNVYLFNQLHKANFVYSSVLKVVKAWDNKRLSRKSFVPFSSEEAGVKIILREHNSDL